jgi:hypothetical protein
VTRAPHYLRVAQALALVSGVGPAAIVAGAALSGCSSPIPCGVGICGILEAPDTGAGADAGVPVLPVPDAGTDASDAETDAAIADGSTDAAADATPDVTTDGGPLPPPDLPV